MFIKESFYRFLNLNVNKLCKLLAFTFLVSISILCSGQCTAEKNQVPEDKYSLEYYKKLYEKKIVFFEKEITRLKDRLKIPALSVAIVKNGKIIYSKGIGYADRANKRKAEDATLYHLASITKTFASVLIMNLKEKGLVNLDEDASVYGVKTGSGIKVRHLLSHTSDFTPGTVFYYNSRRYGMVGTVMEKVTGNSFVELLRKIILIPMGMKNTMPNVLATEPFNVIGQDKTTVRQQLAKPYKLENGNIIPFQYSDHFSPGAGLISNVIDMSRYAIALDRNELMSKSSSDEASTNFVSKTGDTLPYGLGWFVQKEKGKKIVWHYGDWKGCSSLLLRIPGDSLALILLANTDGLSAPFFGLGLPCDVTWSPFALAFLESFVFDNTWLQGLNIESNPSVTVDEIVKHRGEADFLYIIKMLIASAEIDAELDNETAYVNKLSMLYKIFDINEITKYTGRFRTETCTINIRQENGILKAIFFEENKKNKKKKFDKTGDSYYIFPQSENVFYMNSYKKIRFIDNAKGKINIIELQKLGQYENGRRF